MFQVTLTGNIGTAAETRSVGGGTVANFTVAVSVGYGDRKTTEWVRCALWGKQAEGKLVGYLSKGAKVLIVGEPSIRTWEGKDGKKGGAQMEVRVREVELIGAKGDRPSNPNDGGDGYGAGGGYTPTPSAGNATDDIPF